MRGASCGAGVKSSSKFSIVFFSFGYTKVGWAHTTYSSVRGRGFTLSPTPLPQGRGGYVTLWLAPLTIRLSPQAGKSLVIPYPSHPQGVRRRVPAASQRPFRSPLQGVQLLPSPVSGRGEVSVPFCATSTGSSRRGNSASTV